jgi:hypothetical protein
MSNFPTGFAAGLTIRGMPLLQTQPGNVYWVDNSALTVGNSYNQNRTVGGSDSNPGTFQRPFATIAQALSVCQQGNGDIIMIKPGHVEHITGAGTTSAVTDPSGAVTVSKGTTLAFNVAGVAIIGLGSGPLRPTLIFDTAATANIPVQAANMSIQNVLHQVNFANVASAYTAVSASVTASITGNVMNVTAVGSGTLYPGAVIMSSGSGFIKGTIILQQLTGTTGGVGTYQVSQRQTVASGTITTGTTDFNIESCEFRDLSSALNLITVFTDSGTANAADGFRFVNNVISSLGTTAATTAIKFTAAIDRPIVSDNRGVWAILNSTAALIAAGANAMTNVDVARNRVVRPNTTQTTSGLLISCTATTCTGHVYDNYVEHLATVTITGICNASTGLFFTQNFSMLTASADHSGSVQPAAA